MQQCAVVNARLKNEQGGSLMKPRRRRCGGGSKGREMSKQWCLQTRQRSEGCEEDIKRTRQQCRQTRPVDDRLERAGRHDRQTGRQAERRRMSCAGAPERVERRARVTKRLRD